LTLLGSDGGQGCESETLTSLETQQQQEQQQRGTANGDDRGLKIDDDHDEGMPNENDDVHDAGVNENANIDDAGVNGAGHSDHHSDHDPCPCHDDHSDRRIGNGSEV